MLYATSAYSRKHPTLRLYQQYRTDFHLLYKVHHNIHARLLYSPTTDLAAQKTQRYYVTYCILQTCDS